MLFSEPKIPQFQLDAVLLAVVTVSVLFSEPKIPQSVERRIQRKMRVRFCALQRAENSSMNVALDVQSAPYRFSALQRAENSSICRALIEAKCTEKFQCSSASRKFLNQCDVERARSERRFQCSSASRKFLNEIAKALDEIETTRVSVLFSEPKIPQ